MRVTYWMCAVCLCGIMCLAPESYAQPILSMDFNEGSGTEVADSASGLSGVFGFDANPVEDNYPEFAEDSPTGEAGDFSLQFDGNDLVTVVDPDGALQIENVPYTLEAYIKFEGVPGEDQGKSIIYAYGLPGGYAFSIAADRSLFTTTYGIADINPGNAVVPDDGDWHHAAMVFDGATFNFFVDAVLGDSVEDDRGPNAAEFQRLHIGIEQFEDAGEIINPFLGMIDRVRISLGALTPEEFNILDEDRGQTGDSSSKHWELLQ